MREVVAERAAEELHAVLDAAGPPRLVHALDDLGLESQREDLHVDGLAAALARLARADRDAALLGLADFPDEVAAVVAASMYQALRDVVIMRQQQSLPRASMHVVADAAFVKRSLARHECPVLRTADAFEEGCDVAKVGEVVDCGRCPGTA